MKWDILRLEHSTYIFCWLFCDLNTKYLFRMNDGFNIFILGWTLYFVWALVSGVHGFKNRRRNL